MYLCNKQKRFSSIWFIRSVGAVAVLFGCLAIGCISGCAFQDTAIKQLQSVSQLTGVKTVEGKEFIRLLEVPYEYPHYFEYRGIQGNYHFLYEFDAKGGGAIKLVQIYRAPVADLPEDFVKRYTPPTASWTQEQRDAIKARPEKGAGPKQPSDPTIPGVSGF